MTKHMNFVSYKTLDEGTKKLSVIHYGTPILQLHDRIVITEVGFSGFYKVSRIYYSRKKDETTMHVVKTR